MIGVVERSGRSWRPIKATAAVGVMAAVAIASLASLSSCSEAPAREVAPTSRERIVSLSPAITRTLVDLGVEDRIVGRTPYCRAVEASVPAVGSLLEIDAEAIRAVDPDVVLVQPPAAGMNPGLVRLAEREGWTVETFRLDSIRDLEAMLEGVAEVIATGDPIRDEPIAAASMRLREALVAASAPLEKGIADRLGRVIVLFGVDPPMAFGRGTFPDRLLARLGVANAIDADGYPQLSAEDLVELEPDVVILLRDAPRDADDPLARLRDLRLERAGDRIVVVRHPEALTPGSGWIAAAAEIRRALEAVAGASS
ncbi:MAG: hypothetical protein FJ257_11245 [Phycisphaerae bacterium]|nr:hypothetical protein [Phycisphaerae bacterium]